MDAANSSDIIEFHNAVKDYGGGKKIGPANLNVRKGEVMGFLGPNGSGKTTCIRLILGLIRATSGSVVVNGFDPFSKHKEALKGVGYSPELPNIQTFLSPRELLNLVSHELPGFASSSSRREEITRVLEVVGLQEYSDTKVGKLSKGMVQRLSVAQALIGLPKTLILDEPMIGLDPAGSAHFRDIFREFTTNGNGTVFLSSHIMSEVEALCTSVAIVHKGSILIQGPVDEVIRKVLNYSIIFLETSALNSETLQQLQKIPGVTEINPSSKNNAGDLNAIEIKVLNQDEDIRPAISDLIVKSGAKLYSIRQGENMLERAYLSALKAKDGDKH
jgi:ABC-2 type transport system ATP-binding protein